MGAVTDDVVQRILWAAAELSDERIERLVAEARAEAEAEVKGLLKSSIKAALLQRALSKLGATELSPAEAPPQEQAPQRLAEIPENNDPVGCYVYCFTASDRLTLSDSVRGVDERSEFVLVRQGDVQAITTRVPLREFGSAALQERAKDTKWLEQKARAHDQVLKAAMSGGPVVPLRFCTILRNEEDLRRVLETHYERIRESLAALAGRKEWGVKVLAREPATADLSSGRTYLEKKQQAVRSRPEVRQASHQRARECHDQLAAVAEKSTLLPLSNRAEDPVVLNGAYLIPDANERKFHALIATMDERLEPHGLALEVTGPWPPYNFVNLDLSLPAAP